MLGLPSHSITEKAHKTDKKGFFAAQMQKQLKDKFVMSRDF